MSSWGHISQQERTQKGFFPGVCLFVCGQILSARWHCNRARCGEETLQVCSWGQTWGEFQDGRSLSDGSQKRRGGGAASSYFTPPGPHFYWCSPETLQETDNNCDIEKGIIVFVSVVHFWQYCVKNLADVRPRESFVNQVIWYLIILCPHPFTCILFAKKREKMHSRHI